MTTEINLGQTASTLEDNLAQPYMVHGTDISGRLVRLGSAVDDIINVHDYPAPVAALLSEAAALAAAMASSLKFEGKLILQTQSDGPVGMLVADVTTDGALRGYAQFDAAAYTALSMHDFRSLVGKGYIAFTVDQGQYSERYQGIVDLSGSNLAECIQHYFHQSDQVDMTVRVSSDRDSAGKWRAGAILAQRLPEIGGEGEVSDGDAAQDAWDRALAFINSVQPDELTDADLPAETLLYRLFHEDGVRVSERQALRHDCQCSEDRLKTVLLSLSAEELADCFIDGVVSSTCEFCNTTYAFTPEDLAVTLQ
ncbi:Hsp33 family molecular chaperone HslO [Alphaproteobacteria bacterium]|jgi:molecular chaperone Hsp33|nr:Hsp33 family molecular chaperone HslO [Alphaproteobacteria bacterium]